MNLNTFQFHVKPNTKKNWNVFVSFIKIHHRSRRQILIKEWPRPTLKHTVLNSANNLSANFRASPKCINTTRDTPTRRNGICGNQTLKLPKWWRWKSVAWKQLVISAISKTRCSNQGVIISERKRPPPPPHSPHPPPLPPRSSTQETKTKTKTKNKKPPPPPLDPRRRRHANRTSQCQNSVSKWWTITSENTPVTPILNRLRVMKISTMNGYRRSRWSLKLERSSKNTKKCDRTANRSISPSPPQIRTMRKPWKTSPMTLWTRSRRPTRTGIIGLWTTRQHPLLTNE